MSSLRLEKRAEWVRSPLHGSTSEHLFIVKASGLFGATALSHAPDWPTGEDFWEVSPRGRRGAPRGVFVCLRAVLPAAGLEKNITAQFLSTSDALSSHLPSYVSLSLSLSL